MRDGVAHSIVEVTYVGESSVNFWNLLVGIKKQNEFQNHDETKPKGGGKSQKEMPRHGFGADMHISGLIRHCKRDSPIEEPSPNHGVRRFATAFGLI
jgi:hypothetical protein